MLSSPMRSMILLYRDGRCSTCGALPSTPMVPSPAVSTHPSTRYARTFPNSGRAQSSSTARLANVGTLPRPCCTSSASEHGTWTGAIAPGSPPTQLDVARPAGSSRPSDPDAHHALFGCDPHVRADLLHTALVDGQASFMNIRWTASMGYPSASASSGCATQ